MPKWVVTFSVPMFGNCIVDAEDANAAWKKVNNKTWGELESNGWEPDIFDNTVEKDDEVEVTIVEKDSD